MAETQRLKDSLDEFTLTEEIAIGLFKKMNAESIARYDKLSKNSENESEASEELDVQSTIQPVLTKIQNNRLKDLIHLSLSKVKSKVEEYKNNELNDPKKAREEIEKEAHDAGDDRSAAWVPNEKERPAHIKALDGIIKSAPDPNSIPFESPTDKENYSKALDLMKMRHDAIKDDSAEAVELRKKLINISWGDFKKQAHYIVKISEDFEKHKAALAAAASAPAEHPPSTPPPAGTTTP